MTFTFIFRVIESGRESSSWQTLRSARNSYKILHGYIHLTDWIPGGIEYPRKFYPGGIKYPRKFYPGGIKYTRKFYPGGIKYPKKFYPGGIKYPRKFYPGGIKVLSG